MPTPSILYNMRDCTGPPGKSDSGSRLQGLPKRARQAILGYQIAAVLS